MAAFLYDKKAILSVAHYVDVDCNAVECGNERWTYGDLDTALNGLAFEMHKRYGPKPVIAIVGEKHPHTLAMLFAIWKVGGIAASPVRDGPKDIMERMPLNIELTCILVPANERVV